MAGFKKSVDIEQLLHWTFLDELPKRQTSSAEGIWDRLAQYGSLGGINPDPGHGSAQRYAHFGLPHRDAELIEVAVGALGGAPIDWQQNFDMIAGDLGALVSINDVDKTRPAPRKTSSGWSNKRGVITRVENTPRDVILVNSINVGTLVTIHAVKRSRPDWRTEQMRPVPTVAQRGRQDLAQVIGKCLGRNFYTTGSYCPLIWEPSPIEIVMARADYVAWHMGLVQLARTLELSEHIALPPAASPAPWIDGEIKRSLFRQPYARARQLPLKPVRRKAGPPRKKPRNSNVRVA